MRAEVTISVNVEDTTALHSWAEEDFLSKGNDEATSVDFLGGSDRPNLSNCLRQLYDREVPAETGVQVQDSFAEVLPVDAVRFRTIPMVTCSTAHLTKEEVATIDLAFDVEKQGTRTRAYDDVKYNGVFMSPKDCGFYVRIPRAEYLEAALAEMTPEMKAIVEIAISQGAQRIEFDSDEAETEGLDAHEHG